MWAIGSGRLLARPPDPDLSVVTGCRVFQVGYEDGYHICYYGADFRRDLSDKLCFYSVQQFYADPLP